MDSNKLHPKFFLYKKTSHEMLKKEKKLTKNNIQMFFFS